MHFLCTLTEWVLSTVSFCPQKDLLWWFPSITLISFSISVLAYPSRVPQVGACILWPLVLYVVLESWRMQQKWRRNTWIQLISFGPSLRLIEIIIQFITPLHFIELSKIHRKYMLVIFIFICLVSMAINHNQEICVYLLGLISPCFLGNCQLITVRVWKNNCGLMIGTAFTYGGKRSPPIVLIWC